MSSTALPGIGVFGTGPVVKVLVPILRENGFKIEALWSQSTQEAQDAARALNIPFYTNKIDDVLLRKDVSLMFVLCAPNLHAQISVKALGIGKHIVCDKPAGLGQADALKMVKAGQYYPTLIAIINHSFRFLPAFTHMKKCINDNYFQTEIVLIDVRIQSGRLFAENSSYDWQCDDIMGGGALNLIGSHVVDIVTYLTGKRAIRVHGLLRTFKRTSERIGGIRQISAPDFATFQMELEGGALVTANINSHMPGSAFQQEVIVCSETKHLIVRNGDLFGRNTKGNEEVIYLDVEDLKCSSASNSNLPRIYNKGLYKMVAALRESFLPSTSSSNSKSPPSTQTTSWIKEPVCGAAGFEDGLYVQAVLSAIRQSAHSRQWVRVNIMTEQPDSNALISAAVRNTPIFT